MEQNLKFDFVEFLAAVRNMRTAQKQAQKYHSSYAKNQAKRFTERVDDLIERAMNENILNYKIFE